MQPLHNAKKIPNAPEILFSLFPSPPKQREALINDGFPIRA